MTWPPPLEKVRTPWVMIPVLLALIFALGTFWFLQNFEKKAFEEVEGGSPTTWKNPLLAAQRYLQTSGKEVVDYRGLSVLSSLPPPKGALYIHRLPRGLSPSISDSLFAWVESGGHLLLVPNALQSDTPDTGSILSRLGVQVQKEDADCGCPPTSKTDSKAAAKQDTPKNEAKKTAVAAVKTGKDKEGYHPSDSIIELTVDSLPLRLKYSGAALLVNKNQSAAFRINGSYRINYREAADQSREDNKTIKKKEGDWLLQYKVGAGKVTVLSENALFNNRGIGDYNHAFFLSWLLKDDKTVRLLSSSETQGLPAMLWNRMPLFWVSLLALIALALWRLQKQSGILLQARTDEQLNILAHIDASGMFSWRMNKARPILAANRRAMLQRLAERKIGPGQELETGRLPAATLAAKMGLPEKEVFDAFRLRIEGEQDLIQTSRALQKIHRRLHGGDSTQYDG